MSQGEQQDVEDQGAPEWVKDLRREAKELKAEVAKLRPLKSENRLLKAGVDIDHPQVELFLSGWKGNWDDEDEFKSAVEKYKLPRTKSESTEDPKPDPEVEQGLDLHEEIAGAGEGAAGAGSGKEDPDWYSAQSPEALIEMYRAQGYQVADDIE